MAPFKYPGGKSWLTPVLRNLLHPHLKGQKFYDLFCGGLSVSLGLRYSHTTAVDFNPYLIGFYQLMQKGISFDNERNVIGTTTCEVPYEFSPTAYYQLRERWNKDLRRKLDDECFIVFYLLTRLGFNGLIRFNSSGNYNVPFGRAKDVAVRRRLSELASYQKVLCNWNFITADVLTFKIDPTAVIYADPPYAGGFTKYLGTNWTEGHRKLLAEKMMHHPGIVIISDSIRARELYEGRGYQIQEVKAPRSISVTGDRTPVIEILAIRNLPTLRVPQSHPFTNERICDRIQK